jgi:hypothetical protein
MMRPEDAALFQQEVISHADLAPAVVGAENLIHVMRSGDIR